MSGTTDVWIWTYSEGVFGDQAHDVTGYTIHATDGEIGKVDKHNDEAGSSYLLVATGPWIFGKTVMLPAGVIQRVDRDEEAVYVNCSKEQIKNAPEYNADGGDDEQYRSNLGDYYGRRGV